MGRLFSIENTQNVTPSVLVWGIKW